MKNGKAMKIDKGGIINDFIQPNRKQYVIPVYQRNYEWAEEHCTKLFEDIVAAHRTDKYYFTGSVVYAQLESKNKLKVMAESFSCYKPFGEDNEI